MENHDQAGEIRTTRDVVGAWVLCALLLAGLAAGSLLTEPRRPKVPNASLETGCPPGHRPGMEILAKPDADHPCVGGAPFFVTGARLR